MAPNDSTAVSPEGGAAGTQYHPDTKVYKLKISLQRAKPPIWRRVQVTDSTTLSELHDIIQCVMNWDDYHLHQFYLVPGSPFNKRKFHPDDGSDDGIDVDCRTCSKLEKKRLGEVAYGEVNYKFRYTYDFGNNWDHEILVEKVVPVTPGQTYTPINTTGSAKAAALRGENRNFETPMIDPKR